MLAVAMIGLLSACNGGGGEAGETTTSAAPATSAEVGTTSTTSALSSVTTAPVVPNMKPDEIAVRNLLDAFIYETTAVYEAPDPNRTSLLELLTSPYKEYLVGVISEYAAEGTYFKRNDGGVPLHRTNVVQMSDANTAVGIECLLDDRFTYKRGVTDPVDTAISRLAFRTPVARGSDGKWRIADKEKLPPTETTPRCDGLG